MSLRSDFPDARAFAVGAAAFGGSLDDATDHHLRRVARLRPGAPILVGDGQGSVRRARLLIDGLEFADDPVAVEKPSYPVTVAFSVLKGDRNDLVVQKLTEAGVDVIAPLVAVRTVARWSPEQRHHHVERWRAIAVAAAQQAWRPWLPTISEVADSAAYSPGDGSARAEPSAPVFGGEWHHLLVGPEGGWDTSEFADFPETCFSPHTLRGETAAIAAGVVLTLWRMRKECNTSAHESRR